jgi:hypothetical protein
LAFQPYAGCPETTMNVSIWQMQISESSLLT